MSYFHSIPEAMAAVSPGGPVHVRNHIAIGHNCGRIVALRVGHYTNSRKGSPPFPRPGYFTLTFSDSKVDLRKDGDTIYNVPAKKVARIISVFLKGNRTDEGDNVFDQFINQAVRECWVTRLTPTRCRIEYEMPNAGIVGAWRNQTTVGGYTYVAGQ